MYDLVLYAALLAGALPLLLLFIKGRAADYSVSTLLFIWITAIASVYELVCSLWLGINSTIWSQLYSFMEITALLYAYWLLLNGKYRFFIRIFTVLLFIVYLISLWVVNLQPGMALIGRSINKVGLTLLVIIGTFLWFRQLFAESKLPDLWKDAGFYFIAAFFIYYCSTFFLFLLGYYIISSNMDFHSFWIVNVLATLFLRLLMTLGVWQMKKM